MNFGTIMDSMTKNCVHMMYEGKDRRAKNEAKRFINFINLKDPLRKQFRVYHRLSSTHMKDHSAAHMFVEECLRSLREYSFEDILAYNALLETKFKVPKMKSSDIHKDIANLIKYTTARDGGDPEEYIHTFNRVVEHITNNDKNNNDMLSEFKEHVQHSSLRFLQPKHVVKIALKKFNQKYKGVFSEEDRRVFNILRSNDNNRINEYRSNMLKELDEHYEIIVSSVDDDIKRNLEEAMGRIKESGDTESILFGYELLSELKELNK